MDPMTIAALITGAVTLVTSIGGAIANSFEQKNVNDTNKEIAAQNISFTQENNAIQREREDTAMQRAMADYKAAGVNPLLAVPGSGASSAVVSAPQNTFQPQKLGFNKLLEALNPTDYFQEFMEKQSQKERLNLLKEQVKSEVIANTKADLEKDVMEYNFNFFKKYGLPTTSSGVPKQLAEGASLIPGVNRYIEGFNGLGENLVDKAVDFALTPVVHNKITDGSSNLFKGLYYKAKEGYNKVKNWWWQRDRRRTADYINRYNVK